MYNVLLIGAGQLGSRHLQGLVTADMPLNICVVDPSEGALDTARKRCEEVFSESSGMHVGYFRTITESGCDSADLVIVATNADVRAVVIDTLLSSIRFGALMLEKVVFQSEDVFREMAGKLKKAEVRSVVNCPRRLYPFYISLRERLIAFTPLVMEVRGSDWGMGCNALHFVDLFAFLTGDNELRAVDSCFDPVLLESKRKGFYELAGTLKLENNAGTLSLASLATPGLPLEITIGIPGHRFIINEREGRCITVESDGDQRAETRFSVPFQSKLTGEVARQILLSGSCGLTPLEDSELHHRVLLPLFLTHFNRLTGNTLTNCPIT